MEKKEETIVHKKKSTGYNIYAMDSMKVVILTAVLIGLLIDSILQVAISSLPFGIQMMCYIIVLVVVIVFPVFKNNKKDEEVMAYKRCDNFDFIGLYDLSDEKNLKGSDILGRKTEVETIRDMLETVVFSQDNLKQAICLTGKSGCGKSTIISFFKAAYGEEYQIYDLTGNYANFQVTLNNEMGVKLQELKQTLAKLTPRKKVVFIFDQFERYFFLDEEKKQAIRGLFELIAQKNTAFLISMREEYLADFLKEFDMNNMKSDSRNDKNHEDTGILSHLTSIIRDDKKNYYVTKKKERKIRKWQEGFIKENYMLHVEQPFGDLEKTVLEKVGNTVFYCENQNDTKVRGEGTLKTATVLQGKCEMAFGEKGNMFYEKHKSEPLIQQQIIYHMAEYEKKEKQASEDMLEWMYTQENYTLMDRYFDIQLTSTNDFYNASRIVYLLSSARINHVVMGKKALRLGLLESQFSAGEQMEISETIKKLEALQLIRRNVKRSDSEYEIAHDFIAQAFLNYAHSNLDRNIKNALDIFMAEYLDTNKKEAMEEKEEHISRIKTVGFYKKGLFLFFALAVVVSVLENTLYNPWLDIWVKYNPYGDMKLLFPVIMTIICMLYIYNFSQKSLIYCRGKHFITNQTIYCFVMAGAVVGEFFYPHGLIFYGGLLAVFGINCVFLLDKKNYQVSCYKELRNYGWKCAMIGIVFAVVHIILWWFNVQYPAYLIALEMVVLCILVAYSYAAHMTKENLYARAIDAGSERIV